MRVDRRGFLAALGLAGATGALAACGGAPAPVAPAPAPGTPSAAPTTTTTAAAPAQTYSGDLQAVALCAAYSALVADLYSEATSAAGQNRYGVMPAVVSAFLAGAGAQHTDHLGQWNAVLTAAGRPAVSGTPLSIERDRRATLAAALAPTDLLVFALDLETSLGATVVARLGEITDPAALAVGAVVVGIPAMHAATAAFLLGRPAAAPAGPAGAPLGREALTA